MGNINWAESIGQHLRGRLIEYGAEQVRGVGLHYGAKVHTDVFRARVNGDS